MIVFPGKLVFAIIFLLTGASIRAEVPTSSPGEHSIAETKAESAGAVASKTGIPWRILPGEDIHETASLVFPKDPIARNNLIRAIIHTNPEHFPGGAYQPLPAGTIIRFPDLRTIGAYSKSPAKTRKPAAAKNLPPKITQTAAGNALTRLNSHSLLGQLVTQLEKNAGSETQELNTLQKHIELLEVHFNQLNALLVLKIQQLKEQSSHNTPHPAEITANPQSQDSAVLPEGGGQAVEQSGQLTTQPEEPVVSPESNEQPIEDSAAQQKNDAQQPSEPILPAEPGSESMENFLSADTVLLAGTLLTLLIVMVMLRSYRKIKERFTSSGAYTADAPERRQYEALFLRHNEKKSDSPGNPPASPDQAITEARALIEQNEPDAAIELLQKHLAAHQHNIAGWTLLFELLYKSNNKRDFKKNARRFKRLGEFPEIWTQIQNLGSKLEPNEPLYFDEQKRKQRFFSDAAG